MAPRRKPGGDRTEPKVGDIGEIELFSIEAHAPNFCGCHAAVALHKRGRKIRPSFERVVLKRIRSKGNEVTFKVKVEK
jgi:hypothetical protein